MNSFDEFSIIKHFERETAFDYNLIVELGTVKSTLSSSS